MSAANVCLAAEDATELAELLEFVADFIDHDLKRAGEALRAFVTSRGYDAASLKADLHRFAFLLGGSSARLVFGDRQGDEEDER